MRLLKYLCLCIITALNLFASVNLSAAEPALVINAINNRQVFNRSQLYSNPAVIQVTIDNNRAYPGKKMQYTAIRLCDFLKPFHINMNAMLEFIATDKFAVLIPAKKILRCGKDDAIALLAIEPEKKWPLLDNHTNTTAGPFDIIWLFPEKSHISDEYWAWSVVEIKVHDKLDNNTVISPPATDNARVKFGYNIYVSHCAACHSINHIGKGSIGPDLNIPKNPTEYYPDEHVLKQFIRDPKSVRKIKNGRMSGSSEQFLSEKELNDLILYFKFMQKHKQQ